MTYTVQDIVNAIANADTQIETDKLTETSDLTEIGADSLDMMNIFVELEDVIGFIVPDEYVDTLLTPKSIYEFAIGRSV
jgi:acyl carrier protein